MTIDWTSLALQTVNVLILLWLLQRFLYRPVSALLERRQAAIAERFAEAETARAEARRTQAETEARQRALDAERETLLAQTRAEAESERQARLEAAGTQAARQLEETREALRKEREEAEAALRAEVLRLATELSARVLRAAPSAALLRAYLEELCAHEALRALAPAQQARIVTADVLSEAEAGSVIERLGQALGRKAQWSFDVDESLIGGLELHVNGTVIAHTVAQDLARLSMAATGDEHAR